MTDHTSQAERLRMAREREHVLVGIEHAGEAWSEALAIISSAENAAQARASVAAAMGLDDMQATAVLDMQFRRVTRVDRARIRAELADLRSDIQGLTDAD